MKAKDVLNLIDEVMMRIEYFIDGKWTLDGTRANEKTRWRKVPWDDESDGD